MRAYDVQFNSLNPQICVESRLCILRVSKRTPNQVVLAVLSHCSRYWDSVILKARTKLCFTYGRRKVRNQNSASWIHRFCLLLHGRGGSVLLGHRLVLVNGLVVVVDGHGLVSSHRLSRHRRRGRHGPFASNRKTGGLLLSWPLAGTSRRTPCCWLLLLSLWGVSR